MQYLSLSEQSSLIPQACVYTYQSTVFHGLSCIMSRPQCIAGKWPSLDAHLYSQYYVTHLFLASGTLISVFMNIYSANSLYICLITSSLKAFASQAASFFPSPRDVFYHPPLLSMHLTSPQLALKPSTPQHNSCSRSKIQISSARRRLQAKIEIAYLPHSSTCLSRSSRFNISLISGCQGCQQQAQTNGRHRSLDRPLHNLLLIAAAGDPAGCPDKHEAVCQNSRCSHSSHPWLP